MLGILTIINKSRSFDIIFSNFQWRGLHMTLLLFPHPNTIFSSLFLMTMSINNDSYYLIIGTIGCR